MLRTKSDVDQHVQTILRKVRSDHERNLRCFHIAQLYYKVQDFDKARRYVSMYLSTRDDSSSAHKLHGQSLEGLGLKEKALMSYKRSLELEGNQADLVLKICELLCDKEVMFDPSKARYWVNRASALFPHSPILFSLKEKLLGSDSDMSTADFENLFLGELKARPNDVTVRIKLLNLYLDTERVEMALNHAFEVEFKQFHSNQHTWYQCVNKVCEAYYGLFPNKCNWEFYMQWLSALDRLCSLCISEILSQPTNLVEATEAVYSLDQALYQGNNLMEKTPDIFNEFYKHLSSQLPFHIATLLMRRAKKESSMWKEIKRMVGPLMLFATSDPPNTDAAWSLSVKDSHRKLLNVWAHHAQCRVVEAGYVLLALSKDSQSEKNFIEKMSLYTVNNWRDQIFQKAFRTLDSNSSSTSYFATTGTYNELPRKIPPKSSLKPSFFVSSFEFTYAGSLHHLVWLGLQSLSNGASLLTCKLTPILNTTFFKSLLITVNNLNNTGVETLNQLDIDSFLYATVFCAGMLIEDQKANGFYTPEKPHTLPSDITPLLCTAEQSKWWTNACSVLKSPATVTVKNKPSEVRQNLQRGIEVIRGEMPLILLICLARTFVAKVSEVEGSDISKACEERALHLWRLAIPQLERFADRQVHNTSRTVRLFDYPVKDLSSNEISSLLEEGQFFIACHYMKLEQHEKAIEAFKPLRSPQATFNQALIYQKLAEDVLGTLRGDEITSEIRSRHVVMVTKSRDCLYQVRNMIKGDHSHPLQSKLKTKLFEIDDLLSRIEPENDFTDRDGYISEPSISFESGGSPTGEVNNHMHSYSRNKHFPSSTPLRYCDYRHRSDTADFMEFLTVHQNTSQLKIQQVLEQSRLVLDRLENISFEQRNQRSIIEELTNKFQKLETEMKNSISDIKKEIKRPDLYNMLEEEDYNDDMLHYQNIPIYPQRGVQGTNTVTYGAPVAPFFSPNLDIYPTNMGFYNHGTLPFPDGQQVSNILRSNTMPPTGQLNPLGHKLTTPLSNPLGAPTLSLGPHTSLQGQPLSGLQTPQKMPTQFSTPMSANPATLRPLIPQNFASQAPTNVVITTSDTLPTGTPPVQPTLSVTIPLQHRLGGSTSTSQVPHNFQIAMPPNIKIIDKSPIQIDQDFREVYDDTVEEDPLPNFKPIIPLPDEVDVKTGEENEKLLFDKRAKLFRFVDKMWKDRGVGILKILRDETTGKTRILMRREQVHKVCANHFITADMKLEPMSTSDKAWIWCANDFADEEVRLEKLCARFKTVEDGLLFKQEFDAAKVVAAETVQKAESSKEEAESIDKLNELAKSSNSKPETTSSKLILGSDKSTGSSSQQIFNPPGFTIRPPKFTVNSSNSSNNLIVDKTTSDKTPITNKLDNSNNEKVNVGGFTFISPPKLKMEEKTEVKIAEEKKTESPFATFSFMSPQPPITGQHDLKDLLKPSSPKSILKEVQNKTPSNQKHVMFSSGAEFSTLKASDTVNTSSIFQVNSPSIFGTFEKTANISNTSNSSFALAASPGSGEDEFVPNADFKPVIPLPDLVEIKSGEENEISLFEDRAKLLRYCTETKQWKERGTGRMKILKDPHKNVVRLLMRREQVLKVCCNHRVTKDIVLKFLTTSDRAVTWAAKDYSEEVERNEIFTLKFKTPEQAVAFKKAFEKAQTELPTTPKKDTSGYRDISSDKFDSSQSDESSFSSAQNSMSESLAEKLAQYNKGPQNKDSLSMYMPKPGTWKCEGCWIVNEPNKSKCLVCNTPKQSEMPTPSAPPENKDNEEGSLSTFLPKPGSWECGGCYSINKQEIIRCPACSTLKPGATDPTDDDNSRIESGVKDFSIGFGCTPVAFDASKYSFGIGLPHFTFGNQATGIPTEKLSTTDKGPNHATPSIGALGTGLTFGAPVSNPGVNKFAFGSEKFQFTMPTISPVKNPYKTDESGSEHEEEEDNAEEDNAEEDSGDHITFTPIVPLPEKINVVTGEEDEIVLYSHRAKLFRYDSNNKEWKERGLGDIKILKHKENSKIRLLMRREPIMKLCLNHYLTKDIEMKARDNRNWLWHAADFSDGEVTQETFVVRFKTSEIAEGFKKAVDEAQAEIGGSSTSIVNSKVETPKTGEVETEESSKTSDDEIEVVYEKTVSEEDRQKALALKLPPNYYSYKNAPPCPGCAGCEQSDEEETKTERTAEQPKEVTSPFIKSFTPQTTSIFGNSAPTSSLKTSFSFGIVPQPTTPVADKKPEPVTTITPMQSGFYMPDVFGQEKKAESVSTPSSVQSGFYTQTDVFGLFGQGSNTEPSLGTSFFRQDLTSFSQLAAPATNIFGAKTNTTTSDVPTPSFLEKTLDPSFPSLESIKNKNGEKNIFTKGKENFNWEDAGATIFGSSATLKSSSATFKSSPATQQITSPRGEKKGEGNEDEEDETSDKEHDPHFEPVIPLPNEIEVKKCEEDEDVLFSQRVILYRYDGKTKQWKERGRGDMKVLKHKVNPIYRLLMRREIVHKLVCNHLITPELQLKAMQNSENAWCWFAMNLSEDVHEPVVEKLAIKFKKSDQAASFKNIVQSSIEAVASSKRQQ